jgi:hypothetical protein
MCHQVSRFAVLEDATGACVQDHALREDAPRTLRDLYNATIRNARLSIKLIVTGRRKRGPDQKTTLPPATTNSTGCVLAARIPMQSGNCRTIK